MLDNGYVYLAATRLALYRSEDDWAIVIEVFGFSPRAGLPNNFIHTFASRLHQRKTPKDYLNHGAYENYLRSNPHNDTHSEWPIAEGDWQDPENGELVSIAASEVVVRGLPWLLPSTEDYLRHGIELEGQDNVKTFELCRYLAGIARDQLLATAAERRFHVLPEMQEILVLDEWRHPNLLEDELPGGSETFQQLVQVLLTGNVREYRPTESPNTHWRNWPEGGRL